MSDEKPALNFGARKTEPQWQDAFDRFWLAATPRIFEWFGWAIVLAALSYVAKKADSTLLKSVVGLANVAVLFYYFAYFSKFDFVGLPFIKTRRAELLVSAALSGALAIVMYALVRYSANVLVESQP